MFTHLEEEKEALKEQQFLREKWEKQLDDYDVKQREKQREKEQIEHKIRACKDRHYKLMGKGITGILARISGELPNKLERNELQLAEWENVYEKVNAELMHLLDKRSVVRQKIADLPDVQEEEARIVAEQRAMVEQLDTPQSKEYLRVDQAISTIEAFLQMAKEATQIGERAKEEYKEARKLLKKAERWGVLDALSKKGYAAHKKHQYINKANDRALLAQSKRKIVESKVSEMRYDNDVSFQIDESFVFVDFVLDGIYITLLVQEKIEDAMRQIDGQLNGVDRMLNQLRFRSNKKSEELNDLKEERDHLLQKIAAE